MARAATPSCHHRVDPTRAESSPATAATDPSERNTSPGPGPSPGRARWFLGRYRVCGGTFPV